MDDGEMKYVYSSTIIVCHTCRLPQVFGGATSRYPVRFASQTPPSCTEYCCIHEFLRTCMGAGAADSDLAALLALYKATDGPSWGNNSGWNTAGTGDLKQFYGVTIDASCRVIALDLSNNNLNGQSACACRTYIVPPQFQLYIYCVSVVLLWTHAPVLPAVKGNTADFWRGFKVVLVVPLRKRRTFIFYLFITKVRFSGVPAHSLLLCDTTVPGAYMAHPVYVCHDHTTTTVLLLVRSAIFPVPLSPPDPA